MAGLMGRVRIRSESIESQLHHSIRHQGEIACRTISWNVETDTSLTITRLGDLNTCFRRWLLSLSNIQIFYSHFVLLLLCGIITWSENIVPSRNSLIHVSLLCLPSLGPLSAQESNVSQLSVLCWKLGNRSLNRRRSRSLSPRDDVFLLSSSLQ